LGCGAAEAEATQRLKFGVGMHYERIKTVNKYSISAIANRAVQLRCETVYGIPRKHAVQL
jgi:hypothetical protein